MDCNQRSTSCTQCDIMDFSRYMIDVSTMFSGKMYVLTIAEILAPEHGNSNNSTSSPKYLINELNISSILLASGRFSNKYHSLSLAHLSGL